MRNTTIEINWGDKQALLREIGGALGVEILDVRSAKRPGWFIYELQSTTQKYKVKTEPGYTFMGMNYAGGKGSCLSKWNSIHPQTFPSVLHKPVLSTKSINTETWHDIVRAVLETGAKVRANKKQFENVAQFERYCDTLGVFRIIQAERGLNK